MGAVADVTGYLEGQGIAGGSTGWQLFRRRLTDAPNVNLPDQCVVVTEDGGSEPEISAVEGIGDSALADQGILVSVRGKAWDGDASAAKCQAIYDALHGQLNIALPGSGGTEYLRIRARTSGPVFAGFDSKGRPLHTISFLLLR